MSKQSKQTAVRGGWSESARHRWAVAAGFLLLVVMSAGLVYAANELLGPVQAEAQGAACVPSWAKSCASVEVAVDGDNLLIHVPNGSLPKLRRSFRGGGAAFSDTVLKAAGAKAAATLAPEATAPASMARAPAPQAPEPDRSGAPATGLAVYASADGNVCASADTPGCVDVTEQWLGAASDTTEVLEDDDDDPCVDDDEDDEAADGTSLEKRAVAEEDSTDVDPCALVLLGGGGSLLNPLTFLVPIPITIGILAGGGDDDGPPTGEEQGGLPDGPGNDGPGNDGTGDGASGDGGDNGDGNGGGGGNDGENNDGGGGGNDGENNDGGGGGGGGNNDGENNDFPPDHDETPPMSEVPEPISTTLFGIGLLGWAGARARQRRRESALNPDESENPLD